MPDCLLAPCLADNRREMVKMMQSLNASGVPISTLRVGFILLVDLGLANGQAVVCHDVIPELFS